MNWHHDNTRPPWKPQDNRERRAQWSAKYHPIHGAVPNTHPWKWRKRNEHNQ